MSKGTDVACGNYNSLAVSLPFRGFSLICFLWLAFGYKESKDKDINQ